MISPETRMMGLPYREEIMIVGRTMWPQSTSVTDRQTDRRTDRITTPKAVQRIASHGKNRLRFDKVTAKSLGASFFWNTVYKGNVFCFFVFFIGHFQVLSKSLDFRRLAFYYVAAKATYIRLLHGKIGILEGFFGPSSVHRGRAHIVFG